MAKDKMLQQQSWERKKEKMDKKKDSSRGNWRTTEKEDKRRHKEHKEERNKELKEGAVRRRAELKVTVLRVVAGLVTVVLYLAAMVHLVQQEDLPGGRLVPAAVSLVAGLALVAISFSGRNLEQKIARDEEQKEAASHIKGQLERKLTEKEKVQRAQERRAQQAKALQELLKRRAKEEEAALKQAKELAQSLRRRREEREAEEGRARAASAAAAESGECDDHGWTAQQRQRLREAVKLYPEGWSHGGKKRWEMIATEVGGKDARACREAFPRVEAEAQAAAQVKSQGQKVVAEPQSRGLEDDGDWLGEAETADDSFTQGVDDSEDDEEEEEEDNDQGVRERMAVELEPEHKGTEIRLGSIKAMQGCATVQVEVLHLQLTCADCRTNATAYLSGADEDAADAKLWCESCSGLVCVRLRPTLVHRESERLCYVDCVRCSVTDVLPSVLMSVCENCDAVCVHKQEFVRNRLITGACNSCHNKYSFKAEAIRIEQVTPCDPGNGGRGDRQQRGAKSSENAIDDPMEEIAEELRWLRKRAKADPRQQLIKLGSPLPQMGACRHFKKSFKWYRFACCGRAFPCPECHLESGCPAAALGAHASRMICGKCSMEQAYSPARACEKCGFSMQPKGTAHWDDGSGTRNLASMSTKDSKKFKGGLRQATSKTKTSSGKADRVGAKAKQKREHEKKFGRDG